MKKIQLTILAIVSLTIGTLSAGEIKLGLGDTAFVTGNLPNKQTFQAFRFNLPEIPQGSRIDYAGLVMEIQRDTIRSDYLLLDLLPITGDWTKGAVQSGQIPSVDPEGASFAVADIHTGDEIVLEITSLVSYWLKGKKTNRGFMLVPENWGGKTNFSLVSNAGVKVQVFIYYTEPEVPLKEE